MPKTYFAWNPLSDNIDRELDENGNVIAEYTYEPGLHGRLISEYRDGVTYQHHSDGQGNTVVLTNDQGNVTDTFAYTANGEVTVRTGNTPTPLLFGGEQGCYTDLETGEVVARRRIVSPTLARWLSLDPLKFASDLNFYEYVFNCPTMFIDPSGLQADNLPSQLPDISPFPTAETDKELNDNCKAFYKAELQKHPAAVKCYQDFITHMNKIKDSMLRDYCKQLSFVCICCPSHASYMHGYIFLCSNTPSIKDRKADGTAQAICHELGHATQFSPCKEGGPTFKDLTCLERLKLEFQAYLCAGQCFKEGGETPDLNVCGQKAVDSAKDSNHCKDLSAAERTETLRDFRTWVRDTFPVDLDKYCPIRYQPPKEE